MILSKTNITILNFKTSIRRDDPMTKKRKIIASILILFLCPVFMGKKEINAATDSSFNKVNSQMVNINKQNIFSNTSGVKYIGHRGIAGLAPENTLPSFELAGKLGFWGTECDVYTTSDGNWMVLHDHTVDRMTNGSGQIKMLSLSKVQSLNITSGKNIGDYKEIKIPKLQEYLLTCEKWGVVPIIEMKPANNLKYYDKFIKIIKKYRNIKDTIVISASRASLSELRKRDAYLTLGLICPSITDSNIKFVKTLGNAFIDSSYLNITRSQVMLCHENNIKVGAWTVDDTALASSLIEKGVDYITTNNLLPEIKKQEVLRK
jgi:glycerophosphoryl diester phosphodiesterase